MHYILLASILKVNSIVLYQFLRSKDQKVQSIQTGLTYITHIQPRPNLLLSDFENMKNIKRIIVGHDTKFNI